MIYDLIIIGGGPAGITAGIYAVRQKLNTLLITKEFGGQIARKAVAIENYPGFEKISGLELIQKFEKHLRKFTRQNPALNLRAGLGGQVDVEQDEIVELKKSGERFSILTKGKKKFEAGAVIVASGFDPRPLEVVGEKEFLGRGVSYCTICDGPMFAKKVVAVIGGGDAGFEAAFVLSKWAKKIYILEYGETVKANEINQEIVRKLKKVEIITSTFLKEIRGDKFVNSIVHQDRKTGKEKTLPLEGVFVEIGSIPATNFVKELVEFNEKDEIKINPKTNMTKTPGLFAAGDVTDVKWKQIVVAAGEGCKAALSAYGYLRDLQHPAKQ